MQKNIILKSKDKKFNIYGVLDEKKKTNKLIIFVHGLTGHKNEHQFFNAAKFFNKHNIATFRFDLYNDEKRGRRLINCSISTHSEDLNQVIGYFRNKYDKIFLVGHSLGGPTVLGADLSEITKIILWDPSVKLDKEENVKWLSFNKKINAFVVDWGVNFLLGVKMVSEWKKNDYDKWIINCPIPLKVICAGRGILKNEWKKLIKKFKGENSFVIVENAGHTFNEENAEDILFRETLLWIKN